jgi:hypothetical protein
MGTAQCAVGFRFVEIRVKRSMLVGSSSWCCIGCIVCCTVCCLATCITSRTESRQARWYCTTGRLLLDTEIGTLSPVIVLYC